MIAADKDQGPARDKGDDSVNEADLSASDEIASRLVDPKALSPCAIKCNKVLATISRKHKKT